MQHSAKEAVWILIIKYLKKVKSFQVGAFKYFCYTELEKNTLAIYIQTGIFSCAHFINVTPGRHLSPSEDLENLCLTRIGGKGLGGPTTTHCGG